jgi:hypothetical protein
VESIHGPTPRLSREAGAYLLWACPALGPVARAHEIGPVDGDLLAHEDEGQKNLSPWLTPWRTLFGVMVTVSAPGARPFTST